MDCSSRIPDPQKPLLVLIGLVLELMRDTMHFIRSQQSVLCVGVRYKKVNEFRACIEPSLHLANLLCT